ncbi:hypothetical protein PF011_g14839 [Phytophthora fragariae]|uniref:Uncharacterized protein n=1 Tax=Phytophthora fragariae TaxID=53985 RepID=A0A6A3JVJ0_9STRA|nr:hypothetical protein PF011_g14839 [Phytophthora fragariae]
MLFALSAVLGQHRNTRPQHRFVYRAGRTVNPKDQRSGRACQSQDFSQSAAIMLLLQLLLLVTASLPPVHAASATRVVVPDIAGMIYPPSAASSHVQFGAPNSSSPSAYEFVAPTADSVVCTDARLCLELQISSEYQLDPFFLSRYDTNTPLVSATFDGHDANDILPLISGTKAEATVWWFQTNSSATDSSATSPPVIDLLLRLRQRSQRLSARDQLLVELRVELVDSSTTTSAVQAYGVYGNQRVTHTTRRVDSSTVRVDVSITRNADKRDVTPSDAYPLVGSSTTDSTNDIGASCDDCIAFLDSCGDSEICNTKVMPCLLSKLEAMAGVNDSGSYSSSQGVDAGDTAGYSGSDAMEEAEAGSFGGNVDSSGVYDLEAWYAEFLSGSDSSENMEESTAAIFSASGSDESTGSSGSGVNGPDGTLQMDLLAPLAACVADLPIAVWSPIRHSIFCLARWQCALGNAQGKAAGEESPTIISMFNGSQKFSVTPAISGTNNVNLTIVTRDIRSGVADQQTFEYTASASYLGMFLRSFVLMQAADVSVMVESSATDPDALQVSLTYFDALMLKSVDFHTPNGELSVIEASPAQVFIEYPASSRRPNLDIVLSELRARVDPPSDSWMLSEDCLSCSARLFGCSTDEITSKSCTYNSMKSKFGQCIRQQLPLSMFEGMMKGSHGTRPISNELFRCLPAGSSSTATDALDGMLIALSCFAETRCPFGPTVLVQKTQMVVLETTSYIQLLRVLPSSSNVLSIKLMFNLDELLVGSTKPINSTSSAQEIEDAIKQAINLDVSVSSLSGGSEWMLEIIYHNVFLPPNAFTVNAEVADTSVGSATIKQIVMEGGEAQLRTVQRNKTNIFQLSDLEPTSPAGNISQGDACRRCAPAMERCQASSVCSSFSREILVPSLRAADISQAKVSSDSTGKATYEFDLAPTLQAALPDSFEAWVSLAAELYCFTDVRCEMGYERYPTTYLSLDNIFVNLSVRTYPDTQWTATTQNHRLTYNPGQVGVSAIDAADEFLAWVVTTINDTVPGISVLQLGNWTMESSGAAVGIIALYGQLDDLINRYLMAPLTGLPSFSATESNTNALSLPPAGIRETHWSLSLTSIGSKPQYDKLLDLLRFGVDADPDASTPAPSMKYISFTDQCRECKAATLECQKSAECVKFSRETLIPLLRNASDQATVNALFDDLGHIERRLTLDSLYSLASTELSSLESWDALSTELSCFAYRCDLEYSDVFVTGMDYHQESYLRFEKGDITLQVLTYNDTQWNMTMNGSELEYVPDTSLSPFEAAIAFSDWIEAQVTQDPYHLSFARGEITVDAVRWSAAFNVTLRGQWSDLLSDRILLTAPLVPSFEALGGTTKDASGIHPSQVIVEPWELYLMTYNQKPHYSKFMELLAFGFIRDITTDTSSSSGSSASTSSDTQPPSDGEFDCDECATQLRSCQQDVDCQTALGQLIFFLEFMYSDDDSSPYIYDATLLMGTTIFQNTLTVEDRLKMLTLLTCSSSHCIQKSCDVGKPGSWAKLDITPAHTKLYVGDREEITIRGVNGDTFEFTEDNNAASLSLFLKNVVLTNYTKLGVSVDVIKVAEAFSPGLQDYAINFNGLVTPLHLSWTDDQYGESFDSYAAFSFRSSTKDMVDAFRAWITWLSSSPLGGSDLGGVGSTSSSSSLPGPGAGSISSLAGSASDTGTNIDSSSSSIGGSDIGGVGSTSSSSSLPGLDAGSISSSVGSDPGVSSASIDSTSSSLGGVGSTSSSSSGSDAGSNFSLARSDTGEPAVLSASDVCGHCANALANCQSNDECAAASRGSFVSLLRGALASLTATANADDPTRIEVDFGSVLRSLPSDVFNSSEAWHAVEDELICLASSLCQVGYDGGTNYHPSLLSAEEIVVILHVSTFQNTEWQITLNGSEFLYSPATTVTTLSEAVAAFQSWLETWGKQQSLEIHAVSWDDDGLSPATFQVKMFGDYDDTSGRYTMLAPALIPTFEAVGGTLTQGTGASTQNAEVRVTPWNIKLYSTGQDPKYGKLLDLLGYGIAGSIASPPLPASTVASPSHEMGSNDKCRHCASILSECQNDAECVSFSRYSVIPLLQDASLTINRKVLNDYGAASFSADLYPILLPLSSSVNNTPAAWNLVAAELYCLAYDTCNIEYSDVCVSFRGTESCPPVEMDLARSSVNVRLLTYAYTEWNLTANGNAYSYTPDDTGLEIGDEAQRLGAWFKALNDDEFMPLEVQVLQTETDSDTSSAALSLRFLGAYSDGFYQYMLVNPAMIPSFAVAGGTTDGDAGPAGTNITLPRLVVYSDRLKPQYSKLIDLLDAGIANDGTTPSSTPTPTPTSASRTISANDPCRQRCQDFITSCRDDADCLAFQISLASLLGSTAMNVSAEPQNDYGAARVALSMSSVLNSVVPTPPPPRAAWDALAAEISCFSAIIGCDLEYDDVVSPFLGNHVLTSLSVEEVLVSVSIRSYPDTAWTMWVGDSELSYTPSSSFTTYDAPIALSDWIKAQLSAEPFNLVVAQQGPQIDFVSSSAVITLTICAQATNTINGDSWLAPPWLIPRFEVTAGTAGGGDTDHPAAGANSTLWDVAMVSIGQMPQYSKLLDILDNGLDG